MAGAAGEDASLIEGGNTFEGDIENDTTLGGGINPDQRGHARPH